MKKFTLYDWREDTEGGIAICESKDWSPNLDYYPESGHDARPSVKLGEFDTVEELEELLNKYFPDDENNHEDAIQMMCESVIDDYEVDNPTPECSYCNDIHPARDCVLEDGTERMLVVYDDGSFLGKPFIHERKIKFCPMCGRKLNEVE